MPLRRFSVCLCSGTFSYHIDHLTTFQTCFWTLSGAETEMLNCKSKKTTVKCIQSRHDYQQFSHAMYVCRWGLFLHKPRFQFFCLKDLVPALPIEYHFVPHDRIVQWLALSATTASCMADKLMSATVSGTLVICYPLFV